MLITVYFVQQTTQNTCAAKRCSSLRNCNLCYMFLGDLLSKGNRRHYVSRDPVKRNLS